MDVSSVKVKCLIFCPHTRFWFSLHRKFCFSFVVVYLFVCFVFLFFCFFDVLTVAGFAPWTPTTHLDRRWPPDQGRGLVNSAINVK